MPNKAYWNLVEDIMNTTTAVCKPVMEEKEDAEVAELLEDIRQRRENSPTEASEEITLAGLAREFVDVFSETCESYRKTETEEERKAIMTEVKDVTADVFGCITGEFAEVFGEVSKRFQEISEEDDALFEELENYNDKN